MTINVKSEFGLLGDGSDESSRLDQVFKCAKNGEELYFPPGVYGHSLPFDPVNIKGAGRGATIFKRLEDVPTFRFHGKNTDVRNVDASVRDVTLHGNDFTSPLIDMVHASHFSLDNVKLFAVDGIAMHMTEVWDSEVRNLYGNWLGGTDTPAIYINSSRASSGFGSSADNSNQIKFYNLHLEYVRGGGIRIDPAVGKNGPNGIWFTDIKIESPISTAPLIQLGTYSNRIYMQNLYLWVADTGTGKPLKAAIENNSTGSTCIRNAFIGNADKRTLDQGVILNTGSGIAILDNVEGKYGVKPYNHVQVLSGSTRTVRTNIYNN